MTTKQQRGEVRMTPQEHQQRHQDLHESLEELISDYHTFHPDHQLSTTTVLDLIRWSEDQVQHPVDPEAIGNTPA